MDPANRCSMARLTGQVWPLAQRVSSLAPLVCPWLVQADLRADASGLASRPTGAGDSTTCKAHRAAAGAAHSTPQAGSLGKSRGGIGSKIHACTDSRSQILRLIDSPTHHSDLRHARVLMADIPAKDVALDRGYVSAKLRLDLAAQGCTVHRPPKKGMLNPPPWDRAIYAQRHHVENMFSRLKDFARIALRRDKTRCSWMGFAYLAATIINLRIAQFSHTAENDGGEKASSGRNASFLCLQPLRHPSRRHPSPNGQSRTRPPDFEDPQA